MFNRIRLRQPNTIRESSAAKGAMGGCPHMHMIYPD